MKPQNPLRSAKRLIDFKDEDSVFIETENSIFIRGRVHQIIESDEGKIIDIYIQQIADFYAVSQAFLDFKIKVGDCIEFEAKGISRVENRNDYKRNEEL